MQPLSVRLMGEIWLSRASISGVCTSVERSPLASDLLGTNAGSPCRATRGQARFSRTTLSPVRTCSVPRAEMHEPLAPSVTMAMSHRGPSASAACSAVRPSLPSRAAASDLRKPMLGS